MARRSMATASDGGSPWTCSLRRSRCHKLDATVHLVKKAPGKEPSKRHLCEVCFPADSMSDSEQAQKLLELFGDKPPDGPYCPSTT